VLFIRLLCLSLCFWRFNALGRPAPPLLCAFFPQMSSAEPGSSELSFLASIEVIAHSCELTLCSRPPPPPPLFCV